MLGAAVLGFWGICGELLEKCHGLQRAELGPLFTGALQSLAQSGVATDACYIQGWCHRPASGSTGRGLGLHAEGGCSALLPHAGWGGWPGETLFAFSWPPEAINTQVVLAEISCLSGPAWEGSVC